MELIHAINPCGGRHSPALNTHRQNGAIVCRYTEWRRAIRHLIRRSILHVTNRATCFTPKLYARMEMHSSVGPPTMTMKSTMRCTDPIELLSVNVRVAHPCIDDVLSAADVPEEKERSDGNGASNARRSEVATALIMPTNFR